MERRGGPYTCFICGQQHMAPAPEPLLPGMPLAWPPVVQQFAERGEDEEQAGDEQTGNAAEQQEEQQEDVEKEQEDEQQEEEEGNDQPSSKKQKIGHCNERPGQEAGGKKAADDR